MIWPSNCLTISDVLSVEPSSTITTSFSLNFCANALETLRLMCSAWLFLRWWVVTPDMHRVHHSTRIAETNSNFGFNLPWWDRLLGTYRAQPEGGHEGIVIGLTPFQNCRRQGLLWLLALPFRGGAEGYPIRRQAASDPGDSKAGDES